MAKGLNEVKLIGNLGDKPEVKMVNSDTKVVTFSMATSKTFLNANKEKTTITQWHRIVAWRKLADIIEKYVNKGDKVYITGEITYRSYDDAEGNKKYVTEIIANDIILLSAPQQNDNSNNASAPTTENFNEEEHDDLPF